MKRISLFLALLAFAPGAAQAYYGSFYGVRYSPYAYSYHNSGLVRGDVEYTPYAYSYYNSGLVAGYGIYSSAFPALIVPLTRTPFIVHRVPVVPRRTVSAAQSQNGTSSPTASSASINPMDLIRQRLAAKGLEAVNIDRILRVDNQLVSVDVRVKDRNLLIKYWNPQEVEQLKTKESFKQIAYARYKEGWERYAQQYQQGGGEIYTINASEPQAIVAALDSCPRLGPGSSLQTALYAKQ
jgi:hypothetical protein